jgi:4-hydroxy-tetrahydrodipicolinate reductase
MIRIGVLGASGRMGAQVLASLQAKHNAQAVHAASISHGDAPDALLDCDAVIDFSAPDAVLALLDRLGAAPGPLPALVIGSTGWTPAQRARLDEAAVRTPVLVSSNFSTGVLALHEILKLAAPLLKRLGYIPSIVETHHVHKKDAPSGTALSLRQSIDPAQPASVPTRSLREGEVIGDHEVTFQGPADHLTFGHFAQDRSIFARGAIDAAVWLAGRRTGPSVPRAVLGMDAFFAQKISQTP